jgi:hypothetical protein
MKVKPLKKNLKKALDKIGFGPYQIILMFICGSGWMFDGIEILLLSFILPVIQKNKLNTTGINSSLGIKPNSSRTLRIFCLFWHGTFLFFKTLLDDWSFSWRCSFRLLWT